MVTQSVYVNDMAWTTPLGNDLVDVWEQLLQGAQGFSTALPTPALRNPQAAFIHRVDLHHSASERFHKIAKDTLEKLLATNQGTPLDATWLILGTSVGARLDDRKTPEPSLDTWVKQLAALYGFGDRYLAISTACSSGADAIQLAYHLIKAGEIQNCICGGVDVVTQSKRLAHSGLQTMSPTTLSAFDRAHDGTLLGEGAGLLWLSSTEKKTSMQKTSWGRLLGCGSANDAQGLTVPDPKGNGAALALRRSLQEADLSSDDIAIYCAHGSGTPLNDTTEIEALRTVFSQKKPLIFATKGALGHSLGATGAIEAIAVLLALKNKNVPPIQGLQYPISTDWTFAQQACSFEGTIGLSLTLGFGGFDTSLIFGRLS